MRGVTDKVIIFVRYLEFQLTRLMRGVTTYSAIIMQLQGFQLTRLMRGVTTLLYSRMLQIG